MRYVGMASSAPARLKWSVFVNLESTAPGKRTLMLYQ